LLYDEKQLVFLSPGISSDQLHARIRFLQHEFVDWRSSQGEKLQNIRMSVGVATCEGGQDLAGTLQTASLMIRPEAAD
jgi:hypothetical protein